jgi:hypothetical protein
MNAIPATFRRAAAVVAVTGFLFLGGAATATATAADTVPPAVVVLADATPTPRPYADLQQQQGNDPSQQGGTTRLPAYNNQQVTNQSAGAGALSAGAVVTLGLGIVIYFGVKNGKVGKSWITVGIFMGVTVGGTFVGPLVTQFSNSGVSAFGNLFAGL